jgi:probable F420-dependent oxidoreductase
MDYGVERMRFWQFLRWIAPQELPALAQKVEESLFDGIVLGDHLVFPEKIESPYPYSKDGKLLWDPTTPWPDVWVAAAAMAAVTKRIHFSTNIFVLPLRNPFEMARTLSTLSEISGNRVALGSGVGWMAEEYEALGIDFKSRGKRYDEMIDVMRKLWTGEMVEHHGEFFDFPRLQMSPKPTGHIPIYLGGGSPPAMRRAARIGDGWITGNFTRENIGDTMATLRGMLKDAGRENDPFEIIAPVGRDLDFIKMLRDLGATSIIDLPSRRETGSGKTLEEKADYFNRYSDEIIAKL